jgi:hypothetical protein
MTASRSAGVILHGSSRPASRKTGASPQKHAEQAGSEVLPPGNTCDKHTEREKKVKIRRKKTKFTLPLPLTLTQPCIRGEVGKGWGIGGSGRPATASYSPRGKRLHAVLFLTARLKFPRNTCKYTHACGACLRKVQGASLGGGEWACPLSMRLGGEQQGTQRL